jgi:hypothetical protein
MDILTSFFIATIILNSNFVFAHSEDNNINDNYYLCSFPKFVDLIKKDELKVLPPRDGQKGAEDSYLLPLKFEVIDDGHH